MDDDRRNVHARIRATQLGRHRRRRRAVIVAARRGRRLDAKVDILGGVMTRRLAAILGSRGRSVTREQARIKDHRARHERSHE
jgi:hypothetical protein